ncbi:hypothetical protein F0U44_09805 [Nocardioides humilatus]|uniref:Lipoprotein n=1 Tax=Nocardioides humilatus TaxID=2607660 RepID=A0A5B1LDP7_9ACTN|nr:DUF6174 domain-containing protein [Nocardioides humilatus]KAA1418775.1 hypothetical protein F0U44_09805 [Nocardioides humilatus]
MKILLNAAAAALALTALTGCSGDDGSTAKDPVEKDTSSETTEPTVEPTVGTYPGFDAQDYTYVLAQQCFCPLAGPVKITVEDGEVTSAVVAEGGYGMKKGAEAPEYLWITLDEVIAHANDTDAASIEVDWPAGQDWPNTIAIDNVENATDDEVTYVVSDVQVS